jgi:glutathione-independent formaldehyde dehydrogenase
MCKNHGIPMGTGKVELLEIEYPKLALGDRKCEWCHLKDNSH